MRSRSRRPARLRRRRSPSLAGVAACATCAGWVALCAVTAPRARAAPVRDSSASTTRTAVLCESEVWLDYGRQEDRVMIHESRRVAERVLKGASRTLGRRGRVAGPVLHASTGILVDPAAEYPLAWERPRRERVGEPPLARAPFHLEPRLAASESTLADWRELVRRVSAGDGSPAPEAVRLAAELACDELLVLVASSNRVTKREALVEQGNPFAGLVDEEGVLQAWTRLDWALFDARDGVRRWVSSRRLEGWNANSRKRLGDWTEAAIASLPPPGESSRAPGAGSGEFQPPWRTELVLRLGAGGAGGDYPGFVAGARGGWLLRSWWSLGAQLDAHFGFYDRRDLRGSGSLAGVPYEMRRPLAEPEIGVFPLEAATQFQLPRWGRVRPYVGGTAGYTVATLESPEYPLEFLGGWSRGLHAGVRLAGEQSGGGIGLELGYVWARPERDGTDPQSGAPVRERLDLDGWRVLLAMTIRE